MERDTQNLEPSTQDSALRTQHSGLSTQNPALRTQNPERATNRPSRPQSLLIVNADDFGLSEGVNRAVVDAHEHGILTSTTAMANMPAFPDAARLSIEHPNLGVGVHLNLSTGVPVLPVEQVPTLLENGGRFLRLDRLLRGLSLGRLDARQLEAELNAQVERVLGAGIRPTHLDSHHHVHTHPALQPLVVRIALRYGIRGIRCPVELSLGNLSPAGQGGEYLKAAMLSVLGWILRGRARRAGLVVPDHFRGLMLGVAFSTDDLHRILARLPLGSTELMCHPGYLDEQLRRWTSYSTGRDRELRALLDSEDRAILDARGVTLASYRDL